MNDIKKIRKLKQRKQTWLNEKQKRIKERHVQKESTHHYKETSIKSYFVVFGWSLTTNVPTSKVYYPKSNSIFSHLRTYIQDLDDLTSCG